MNEYINKELSFSMAYPDEWDYTEEFPAVVVAFLSPLEHVLDQFRENIIVTYEECPPDRESLEDNVYAIISTARRFIADFQLHSEEKTTFAGESAVRLIYSGTQGYFKVKFEVFTLLRGSELFSIAFTAEQDKFDKYQPIATSILETFQLLAPDERTQATKVTTVHPRGKYSNKHFGITLEYPPEWDLNESVHNVLVAFVSGQEDEGDTFRENVTINVTELDSESIDLKEYKEAVISHMTLLTNELKVIQDKKIKVAKQKAGKLVYKGILGEQELQWDQVFLFKGHMLYTIVYVAEVDKYNKFKFGYEKILKTFKFEHKRWEV